MLRACHCKTSIPRSATGSLPRSTHPRRFRSAPGLRLLLAATPLISAPTGAGKTLAAFLAVIDSLVRDAVAGGLEDRTRVLYVSPLKALSNDIQKNLQQPLDGIRSALAGRLLDDAPIRALVRTGDTPQSERARMRRQPPHILVTTPESLYILLTSESGRDMLSRRSHGHRRRDSRARR